MKNITDSIYYFRGKKVMLDRDLAQLFSVTTKALNQSVNRNSQKFPEAFMFQLIKQEQDKLVINSGRSRILKHATAPPRAFTRQGVARLPLVLNSEYTIQATIDIMRAFIQVRNLVISDHELRQRLILMRAFHSGQYLPC